MQHAICYNLLGLVLICRVWWCLVFPVLSCLVSFRPVLSCLVLCCLGLSCPVLSHCTCLGSGSICLHSWRRPRKLLLFARICIVCFESCSTQTFVKRVRAHAHCKTLVSVWQIQQILSCLAKKNNENQEHTLALHAFFLGQSSWNHSLAACVNLSSAHFEPVCAWQGFNFTDEYKEFCKGVEPVHVCVCVTIVELQLTTNKVSHGVRTTTR